MVFPEDGIVTGLISHFGIIVNTLPFLAFNRFLVCRSHQNRTERRTKHECADAGEAYCSGEGHTELGEERTGRTAHKGHRNEHRHEDEGTRDNGRGHFAQRFARSLRGLIFGRALHFARFEFCHHRFDDNDGIIDDRTDGKHQSEERDDI